MKRNSDRHNSGHRPRRRKGGSRFFLSALAIAVIVFVVVEVVTHWLPWSSEKTARNRVPASVTAVMPQPAEGLAGFKLFMSRCKGSPDCPYYALSAQGDTLEYVGVRDVAKRGKVEEALTSKRKRELLALVRKAAFFGLANSYELGSSGCRAQRTDAPTLTIGVTLNGQTKVVKANRGCSNVPPRLIALAQGIDRVSHSARWTGVQVPAGKTGG